MEIYKVSICPCFSNISFSNYTLLRLISFLKLHFHTLYLLMLLRVLIIYPPILKLFIWLAIWTSKYSTVLESHLWWYGSIVTIFWLILCAENIFILLRISNQLLLIWWSYGVSGLCVILMWYKEVIAYILIIIYHAHIFLLLNQRMWWYFHDRFTLLSIRWQPLSVHSFPLFGEGGHIKIK